MVENIIILGVTGSIGTTALKVIEQFPERFSLVGFSYHKNFERAIEIQQKFNVKNICCSDQSDDNLQKLWKSKNVEYFNSTEDLLDIDYNAVIVSVVGSVGVRPTYKAIDQGRKVYLANKESMVMAGDILIKLAAEKNSLILPIDSEHNSIYRLLQNKSGEEHITITASGGALRDLEVTELANVSIRDVLQHPTWQMGAKITVDSATMVNKALEIIEAHYLFNIAYDDLSAVIHPESFVHAILQSLDGSMHMHAYNPDMIYAISHCLFYPDHAPRLNEKIRAHQIPDLQFYEIDKNRYPAYFLGVEAGKKGSSYPAVFNACNEIAVQAFLDEKIGFVDIANTIETIISSFQQSLFGETLDGLFAADEWTREETRKHLSL